MSQLISTHPLGDCTTRGACVHPYELCRVLIGKLQALTQCTMTNWSSSKHYNLLQPCTYLGPLFVVWCVFMHVHSCIHVQWEWMCVHINAPVCLHVFYCVQWLMHHMLVFVCRSIMCTHTHVLSVWMCVHLYMCVSVCANLCLCLCGSVVYSRCELLLCGWLWTVSFSLTCRTACSHNTCTHIHTYRTYSFQWVS